MLWIRDILVRILVRIRGSVPPTSESGSDFRIRIRLRIRILLFSSVADKKMPTKVSFLPMFFAYYFLKVLYRYIKSVFKDKKSKRSRKIITRNQGFFCWLMEGFTPFLEIKIRPSDVTGPRSHFYLYFPSWKKLTACSRQADFS